MHLRLTVPSHDLHTMIKIRSSCPYHAIPTDLVYTVLTGLPNITHRGHGNALRVTLTRHSPGLILTHQQAHDDGPEDPRAAPDFHGNCMGFSWTFMGFAWCHLGARPFSMVKKRRDFPLQPLCRGEPPIITRQGKALAPN